MPITVSIVKNLIPQVRAAIEEKSEEAVRNNAHDMADYAHDTAPRQTGAFAASIYVNGPGAETTYAEAAGAAKNLNAEAHIVPELRAAIIDPKLGQLRDTVTGRFTNSQAIVSSAVEYSIYLEEGTVHMAPRPTLRQAALAMERPFVNEMRKIADGF